jgi:hypothetical protein
MFNPYSSLGLSAGPRSQIALSVTVPIAVSIAIAISIATAVTVTLSHSRNCSRWIAKLIYAQVR